MKKLVTSNLYSLREIARRMGCDVKTVIKYSQKLGVVEMLNTKNKYVYLENIKDKGPANEGLREVYRKDIEIFIVKNEGCTRNGIRNELKKQYSWLYRNDRVWLNANLPESARGMARQSGNGSRVDWVERDKEVQYKVQKAYIELLAQEKPVRITKSLIGRKMGMNALLDNYIDKLPITKELLGRITEDVEMFQIRRITVVCEKLYQEKGDLKKWEVIKLAGIRSKFAERLNSRIEEIIECVKETKNLTGLEKLIM